MVIGVKYGGEAHNLLHGHTGLRSHATHSRGELGDIGSGGRTVLRQLVYHGTYRKQGLLGAEALFIAEDACQFGEGQRGTATEVIESDIDFIGGTDEA